MSPWVWAVTGAAAGALSASLLSLFLLRHQRRGKVIMLRATVKPGLIEQYARHHKSVWPEVENGLRCEYTCVHVCIQGHRYQGAWSMLDCTLAGVRMYVCMHDECIFVCTHACLCLHVQGRWRAPALDPWTQAHVRKQ